MGDDTFSTLPHPRCSTHLPRLILAAAIGLAGCSRANGTPVAPPSTPAPTHAPFVPSPTPPPTLPQSLAVWVPEDFAPEGDTASAQRFASRLATFEAMHPGLTLDVRVKARSGSAGITESLLAADAAAPDALPDLALLDPAGLEAAATNGLLAPLEGSLTSPSAQEWTEAAVEAARVNGVFFGLPFASDAIGLAFRKDAYTAPPGRWIDLVRGPSPFVFPAGDPAALFLLAQYESLGGTLIDVSRRPSLDPTRLTAVLDWEGRLHDAGRLPLSTGQMTSTSEAWSALLDGRAVSSAATYQEFALLANMDDFGFVPPPGRDAPGQAYASTWCWALLAQNAGGQSLAIDLLAWLTQPDFAGPLARDAGLLPAMRSGLDSWPQDPLTSTAAGLLDSLLEVPSLDLQAALGPRVRDASLAVLTGKADAATAAQAAAAPALPAP
jgi:ABC-type glycerol-3-phosphate transport system substrate-binding protein